ncbi:hypothetical protein SAMN04488511_11335 [Pedobacter suwonensis]|uniref:AhpC/TSA family protein n=1 Tax=Pedobacter suwonensis TaxID=332999 RepID=A0A1I0TQV4_9SPHI|nr:hypothetical protein [Pedobacter suwonensis]SFA54145.1 hypothetical protein SAMN04488511_11335 [Pedobacter suwonensis]
MNKLLLGLILLISACAQKQEKRVADPLKDASEKDRAAIETVIRYKEGLRNKYEGQEIKKGVKIFDVEKKEPAKLDEIAKDSPILVLRFSEMECSICTDTVLRMIRSSGINKKKVMLLCDIPSNVKNIRIFREKFGFEGKIYRLDSDLLAGNELKKLGFPFMFIADGQSKLNQVFFPERYAETKTRAYLKSIKEKLN